MSLLGCASRIIPASSQALLTLILLASAGCLTLSVQPPPTDSVRLPDDTLDLLTTQLQQDLWHSNLHWSARTQHESRKRNERWHKHARWVFRVPDGNNTLAEIDAVADKPSNSQQTEESITPLADAHLADEPSIESSHQPSATKPSTDDAIGESSHPEPHSRDWDGYWPLSFHEMLDRIDAPGSTTFGSPASASNAPGDAYLEHLADRDDLVGWNAAILFGMRNPAAAADVAPTLERLVSEPPQYHPSSDSSTTPSAETNDDQSRGGIGSAIKRLQGHAADQNATDDRSRQHSVSISPAMRAAAAEAWCLVLAHISDDKADALAPAGRLLQRADLPVEIRGELFRGVGRWVAPSAIPRLANALHESGSEQRAPVEIRRAAVDACEMHAIRSRLKAGHSDFDAEIWPATVWNCQFDADPHVRETFGRWVATVGHPDAFRLLSSQLLDTEPSVRESALIGLGILNTDDARRELRSQAARKEVRVRAFAARGLAHWGPRELAPFVSDKSHYVREAVVAELARFANVESALLLHEFVTDSNPQVQMAVVNAVDGWPKELAVPVLLRAMQDGSLNVRQRSFLQLRARTGIQRPFPFDEPRDRRVAAVQELVRKHNLPFDYLQQARHVTAASAHDVDEMHAVEVRSSLEQWHRAPADSPESIAAREMLRQFKPADLPLVERYLREHPEWQSPFVYEELLPTWNPVYRALNDLKSDDVVIRRRAAQSLAEVGAAVSLSPVAVRRLGQALTNEQDELVWRYAMSAVMQDAGDESAHIALLAVNHVWPDIRILGCQYMARHGKPRDAVALVPLFADSNRRVQLAAIDAAGRCHNPAVLRDIPAGENQPGQRGLLWLLTSSDRDVRFAAAKNASRLGDPHAMQELMRLGFDPNATIREQAVRAMGETGQSRFVDHLVRLAWTENNSQVKRSLLSSLEQLVPPEQRPVGLADDPGYDTKIDRWVRWSKSRQPGGHMASPASADLQVGSIDR